MNNKEARPHARTHRSIGPLPQLDEGTVINNMDLLYRAYQEKGEAGIRELLQNWKSKEEQPRKPPQEGPRRDEQAEFDARILEEIRAIMSGK